MKPMSRLSMLVLAVPLTFGGCMRPVAGTSRELVDARAAYARAAASAAATDAAPNLAEARRSLDAAERAHAASPQSDQERHLAAVARRRVELAIAHAHTVAAERQVQLAKEQLRRNAAEAARAAEEAKAQADATAQQLQVANEARVAAENKATASRDELARLERELADTQRQLAARGNQVDDTTRTLRDREVALQAQVDRMRVDLDRAHQERDQAQQERDRAQQERDKALTSVREFATVRESTDRGLVITVPAEVMFGSGSARLLPRAQDKLDELAAALDKLGPDQTFTIEGHTDSRGGAEYNQRLSKRRATAVRTYLISQGVDGDRIVARGRGEAEPVASNTDPEGRAENRRVEIVVSPATVSTR